MITRTHTRNNQGNILVLCCMSMAFVALLMVLGASFGGLAFVHNRLQSSADEIALAGARALNDMDRIGQMNNMLIRSRQLVYAQDTNQDNSTSDSDAAQHLAIQLVDEAVQSAQDLELERSNVLMPTAQSEALAAMQAKFQTIGPAYQITLPWLKISAVSMPQTDLGEIAETESNVVEIIGQTDLDNLDRSDSLVNITPGVNLYKHDSNHHLHGPHSYLAFNVSSLPAPINKTVSPARAVLTNEFRPAAKGFIPSAAQTQLALNVETGLGASAQSKMICMGTAAATGGSVQQ